MKIVFFGTANVALPILEVLNKQHQILAVVTNPDAAAGRSGKPQESPVSALAVDLKLPVLKPETVKNNPEFLNQLSQLGAEIFVVVAYGKILPAEIINLPKYKTVNVHFAALPKYRGPSPIQAALLNGEQQTGTSVFILDEKVDDGPLLAQEIVAIDPDDNYFTLSDKLAKLSAQIIVPTLEGYVGEKITPLPQDEARASHTKIITKEDGKIDWSKPAAEIYNRFRAFYIWPGIWTVWNGKKIKLLDIYPLKEVSTASPGTILAGGKIVCGQGTVLEIKSLQLEGRSEMDAQSFLNGYREFAGSKLI